MSQLVTEEFEKMTALCNQMEEKKEVDPIIAENIERAKSTLSSLENLLSSSAAGNVKSAFLAYHIIRNTNLILSKMKDRFRHAKENYDNPVVAQDSLMIFPLLSESVEVAMRYGGKHIDAGIQEVMQSHILKLREVTTQVDMALSIEEEAKTISASPEAVRAEEQKLSDAVKQQYVKEENIY